MTNEEILKRFEFELGIGLFNTIDNKIIPFDSDNYCQLDLITRIVEKLGYNKCIASTSIYLADGIALDIKNKYFWYYEQTFDYIENYNEIPEYLYKYTSKRDDFGI